MSRISLTPKPDKQIGPRRTVTGVVVGLEEAGDGSSWIAVSQSSKWYYKIDVNGEKWQELATATQQQVLDVIGEYVDIEQNLSIRVRDKIRLYLDPEEAVSELDGMESP